MVPVIDKRKTGVRLRQLMDERGLSVKDVQQYLGLGSVQSVYHWLIVKDKAARQVEVQ